MIPEFAQKKVKHQKGRYDLSHQLFSRAEGLIPGGVNSPVRAFNGVGGKPIFIAGATGAILQDMDENQYIDYVLSWGPMILGHAHPHVIKSVGERLTLGTSFGAPTDQETYLADLLVARHKSVEQVRLVNSGTEATMSAIRLARGHTGKSEIIKCDGCYHGHADSLLVSAGSGLATGGHPSSAGVPKEIAKLTHIIPFNNPGALEKLLEKNNNIACFILEPIAGNMGCIAPHEDYLKKVRHICTQHGVMLIIDEVMTGCRVAYGSAQEIYNVEADITCFGKVIGGGMPLAAYGGKKEIMQKLAPVGDVYQAGTLSGNPLAVSAGCATLEMLPKESYTKLNNISSGIVQEISAILSHHKVEHSTTIVGSMFSIFFQKEAPKNFSEISKLHVAKYSKFFHTLLNNGVYIAPSAYETCFVSLAHEEDHIQKITFQAIEQAAKTLKGS
jgi:glutamate-1-semialdehyde 2,1-aminomutase